LLNGHRTISTWILGEVCCLDAVDSVDALHAFDTIDRVRAGYASRSIGDAA
jgi:hypothetical protein